MFLKTLNLLLTSSNRMKRSVKDQLILFLSEEDENGETVFVLYPHYGYLLIGLFGSVLKLQALLL